MPLTDLARVLLDTPRWVETRSMLLAGEAVVTGLSGDRRHFVAASTRWPLVSVVGAPEAAFIEDAAARAARNVTILCGEDRAAHVATALPGWRRMGAAIHAWPGGVPLPLAPPVWEARLLAPGELAGMRHVPRALHEDLMTASAVSPVAGALAGGAPVAFCYAIAMTETLWDISIDTLEEFRRRGLAARAMRVVAATLGGRGKWPVWGAEDDNEPSRNLAAKLGFVAVERAALFHRPGG